MGKPSRRLCRPRERGQLWSEFLESKARRKRPREGQLPRTVRAWVLAARGGLPPLGVSLLEAAG